MAPLHASWSHISLEREVQEYGSRVLVEVVSWSNYRDWVRSKIEGRWRRYIIVIMLGTGPGLCTMYIPDVPPAPA